MSENDRHKSETYNMPMDFSNILLLVLMAVGVWFAFILIRPYADVIVIAGVLAVLVNPVYHKLLSLLNGRRTLTAVSISALLTILIAVLVIGIVGRLAVQLVTMGQDIVAWVEKGGMEAYLQDPMYVRISGWANRYIAEVNALLSDGRSQQESLRIGQWVGNAVADLPKHLFSYGGQMVGYGSSLILKTVVFFMMVLFMLRDQEGFRAAVYRYLPFTWGHEDKIDGEVVTLCRSAIFGIFITAIIQGISVGIAFWIAGLPAVVGGFATAISAFIPLIGTGIVWLPAVVYLAGSGQVGYAVFITVWWAVAVAPVDNILRPILVGEGAEMSTPLVFLFILGGIHFFGLLGILYGPLVLGVLLILLRLYGSKMGVEKQTAKHNAAS